MNRSLGRMPISPKYSMFLAFVLIFFISAGGCALINQTSQPPMSPTQPAEMIIPSPGELPDVQEVVARYLDGWKDEKYAEMYALLTSVSQAAQSEAEFIDHYQGVAIEAALTGVSYEISSILVNPDSAQARYRVNLNSVLVGDISRETLMNLSLENGEWRVQWDDTLILPELDGGNYLMMDRNGYTPARANIYDRNQLALVSQADATALGVYSGDLLPDQREDLLILLSDLTGKSVHAIEAILSSAPEGANWYLPVGQVSSERIKEKYDELSQYNGLIFRSYKSRYYFEGGIAPHVVGYVSAIQPEELDEYLRKGYRQDERVGRSGLEAWGETYLAGKRGGALYVMNAQGQPVTRLAEASAQPSQAIYTTLDRNLQSGVQQALGSFRGAVVVLERDSGKVLAMASSPGFDPNAFEPVNFNSSSMLEEILTNVYQPLLNRATQGQYPLGSVFKIITMAAGLDSGKYTVDSTYQCGYFFEELPGVRLHDWTYDYYSQDGRTIPSGLLNLSQGLMRSCNPWFWHIGLALYNQGLTKTVSEMARDFGLGKITGIEAVDEAPGSLPDPNSEIDAVNMAIGQGDVLVTPLQVANFVAAIGNGGTRYQPTVIDHIASSSGKVTYEFSPKVLDKLSLSDEHIRQIQEAMVGVIRNEDPRGTAWHRFTGLEIPVAGKTGTAQTASDRPHAWFAGYTFAEQEGRPDIAIAVLVENIGEGSDYAAPIFRRVVELYFMGQPQKLYWWETTFNVTATLPGFEASTPTGAPAGSAAGELVETPVP